MNLQWGIVARPCTHLGRGLLSRLTHSRALGDPKYFVRTCQRVALAAQLSHDQSGLIPVEFFSRIQFTSEPENLLLISRNGSELGFGAYPFWKLKKLFLWAMT
jgi:hypothetical protein